MYLMFASENRNQIVDHVTEVIVSIRHDANKENFKLLKNKLAIIFPKALSDIKTSNYRVEIKKSQKTQS